ncbi:MutS protein homolog 1A [Ectocarpus siliculosus]|uniref:MutS protein homolog 1A n=1 Tax=Ectocarpus siliculosus TaxID=2880 RepID=D7FNS7_ECTSI|nr:MutS protein homolog 1A [Ectocarpus siliculosus]|eukprot:CBJ26088.1 MutS protein homolog 1A [Ectocarpus siliculosus]
MFFCFFLQVEFRGSLSLEHEATKKAYGLLHRTASELCTAVKEDFPNAAQDLTFDIHNNAIFLTKLPANSNNAATRTSGGGSSSSSRSKRPKGKEAADGNGDGDASPDTKKEKKKPKFLNPHDRNGKLLPKRFTTERVSTALSGYLTAIEETKTAVQSQLQALSDSIVTNNDLPVIAQAAHWSVICQAMEGHVRHALSSGWSLPSLKDLNNPDMSMKVENLVPYWLPRQEAVPNSFDFGGLFLLTAPNMSGKSTLMRAVLACSLLSNAGLFAPCTSAVVPRFDCFFLRTASYDIPAEDKSAFALEMDDVRVMLRDSSDRSLALVDELGKGTSARTTPTTRGGLTPWKTESAPTRSRCRRRRSTTSRPASSPEPRP